VSVLDPNVTFPKAAVYYPFENFIPGGASGAYMQWYRAIFLDNKRLPAPVDFQSVLTVAIVVQQVSGSNNFTIQEIGAFSGSIIGYCERNGREIVVTPEQVYVDNRPRPSPGKRFRCGFTPQNTPLALVLDSGHAKLQNLDTSVWLKFDVLADDLMVCEDRLYLRCGETIGELTFFQKGDDVFASQQAVATVMPKATQLFQGVAFQDMFGAVVISVFPESQHHRQLGVKELVGYRITEAKYEHNVLMVLASEPDTGHISRFVLRFAKDWTSYDLRRIDGVTPVGVNFTVLPNGIVICINEEEHVEIFSNQKDATGMKVISDPAIKADVHLCHSGTQARFARAEKLYNFSLRK
jgi:hypothetical protein